MRDLIGVASRWTSVLSIQPSARNGRHTNAQLRVPRAHQDVRQRSTLQDQLRFFLVHVHVSVLVLAHVHVRVFACVHVAHIGIAGCSRSCGTSRGGHGRIGVGVAICIVSRAARSPES